MIHLNRPARWMTRHLLSLTLACLTLPAAAADLQLNVGPLASAQGSLMVALYNSAASFRKEAVQQQKITAVAGRITVKFSDLAPGDYAVALFHDTNDNGKLDSNLFGIPQEPYGFSRIDRPLMGAPGWDDVRFSVPTQGSTLDISLR